MDVSGFISLSLQGVSKVTRTLQIKSFREIRRAHIDLTHPYELLVKHQTGQGLHPGSFKNGGRSLRIIRGKVLIELTGQVRLSIKSRLEIPFGGQQKQKKAK